MTNADAAGAAATEREAPTIWRVDDRLWVELAPLLAIEKPRKKPGRPRRDDRPLFDGLIWLARTGGQWSALPVEFGPKSTLHDRFQEWVASEALERAWALVLREYDELVGLDWHWQAGDGCLVKAPLGKKGGPAKSRRPGATRPTAANAGPSATC
jgi:transposase